MKLNRSQKLLVTTEARVLKILREAKGMTMQEAANAIGKSKPYIAHIEGGRMDITKGDNLIQLLNIYGMTNPRSFEVRVRDFEVKARSPVEKLGELAHRLPEDRVVILLKLAQALAEGRAIVAF